MHTYPDDQPPIPPEHRYNRRTVIGRAGAVTVALAAATTLHPLLTSATQRGTVMLEATPITNGTPADAPLTVALVHGAFTDSSSWSGVITKLQAAGLAVQAISNPLRGVSADAAYVASAIDQIPGPVLLVGHSYGGAVISVAAAQATNVVGLVYVAAYMPDEGETILDLAGQFPPTALAAAIRPATYPTADPANPGTEFYLDPSLFHDAFAADVEAAQAQVMAVAQRPVADIGFGEPAGPIAWKTLPSWYVLATADQALGIELERFMADRAGSITVEADASHAVAVSHPEIVADLIMTAAGSVA